MLNGELVPLLQYFVRLIVALRISYFFLIVNNSTCYRYFPTGHKAIVADDSSSKSFYCYDRRCSRRATWNRVLRKHRCIDFTARTAACRPWSERASNVFITTVKGGDPPRILQAPKGLVPSRKTIGRDPRERTGPERERYGTRLFDRSGARAEKKRVVRSEGKTMGEKPLRHVRR